MKKIVISLLMIGLGSPPRLRVKPTDLWQKGKDARITPAPAGKTPTRYLKVSGLQDHPRACG